MRLKDKVAVVTGAGGGMGIGISSCLAREGATIVASDINKDKIQVTIDELQIKDTVIHAITADITNESECQDLVKQVIDQFSKVDILVNNAGHFGSVVGGPFTNFTGKEWDSNFEIHVKGPFYLCKAIAPHMISQRYGKIVNISSGAAKRDPTFLPAYAAAKNAMLSLTRLTAKDLGPYNINVNAVCPGFVWTNFWHTLAPKLAESDSSLTNKSAREVFDHFIANSTPLQREQSAEDIGNMVAFLASEEARNVTGQTIHVNGGMVMD